jgi:multicomponent Na+:H+ antiporter subunit G
MSMTLRIIIDVLIGLGAFFALAGTVGVIRMPDCFCRMQSSTNIATLGLFLAIIGAFLYAVCVLHSWQSGAKIAFIGIIYIIQNPAGAHAIARAAYRRGNESVEMVCDDMKVGEEIDE